MSTHDQGIIERVIARADRGTHEQSDRAWIQFVCVELLMHHDVAAEVAEYALDEAMNQATASGKALMETYGDPEAWARERITAWRDEGADAFDTGPDITMRTFAVGAPSTAAMFSILFGVVFVAREGGHMWWSWAVVLMPLMLSLDIFIVIALYQRVLQVWNFAFTAVSTVAVGVVCILATAGVSALARTWQWHASTGYFLTLIGAYGAMAWAIAHVWPAPPPQIPRRPKPADMTPNDSGQLSDAQWVERFSRELRVRLHYSDAQVRRHVKHAQTQAAGTGGLAEVFGVPEACARKSPANTSTPALRIVWLRLTGAVLVGLLLAGVIEAGHWGLNWHTMPLLMWELLIVTWLAAGIHTWRRTPR